MVLVQATLVSSTTGSISRTLHEIETASPVLGKLLAPI
jgi:hypothetical protein